MCRFLVYSFVIAIALSSCSVQRYLPPGERLYRGATILVEKEEGVTASAASLKKQLKLASKPAANKFVFGRPYKVWWWFVIGQPKRPRGVRAFFRNKLGEPPVLSSKVNPAVVAQNMQDFLSNLGYFHATVKGDTTNNGYMTKALYSAHVLSQTRIKNISWINDNSALVKLLAEKQQDGILKPGNSYRLSDIQAERSRLDLYVKTKGYYYFSPDYIMVYADSTIGNNEVNLLLSIKRDIPENARHPFTINRIAIFPNYTLLLPPPDTSKKGMTAVDGLLIRDTVHKFKSSLFQHVITYRPGEIYSSRNQNATLNRLINLGSFKFAKNRFEQASDPADPYRLNVFYYLTPAKRKTLQAEVNGFSKENRFVGTQLSVNWRNQNAFKGAELLSFKVYGGFEFSFADTLKNSNNYRLGGEAYISLPRFYLPFFKIKESNLYPPHTRLLVGYENYRKALFYTKNIYRVQYEFNWKQSSNIEHVLSPVALTYINAGNVSDTFSKQVIRIPSLSANVYDEIILGSFYDYTFNTANPFAKRQWYFNAALDVSGNVAGLLSGAKNARQKTIFKTPFAQYIKTDFDIHYQVKLPHEVSWINRLLIGVGLPYKNSNMLPFSKQYVIGGSSSLRGFRMRQMGPGSYLPTRYDQVYFMVIGGDYKLQFNTELRFPIFAKFTGAAFLDAGNIWTKDTLLFGKAGQLKKNFLNELAVAAGAGIRFDAGLVLLRADLGIALRKPYLPVGQRWVINKMQLGDRYWRQQNLILNLALGFPF